MSTPGVYTLSSKGVVKSPVEMIDYLLAYGFGTDGKQSYTSPDSLFSFQDTIANYTSDMVGLCSALKTKIETYFGPYFQTVSAEVSQNLTNPLTSESQVTITIYISVVSFDGESTGLQRDVINATNSPLRRVIAAMNNGDYS